MTTTTRTRRGFSLRCPHCGEQALRVHLDNTDAVQCGECEDEIDRDEIVRMIAQWQLLLAWVDQAPEFQEE